MLALKLLLMILGLGLFGGAAILVAYDVYMATRLRWLLEEAGAGSATPEKRLGASPLSGRYGGDSRGN